MIARTASFRVKAGSIDVAKRALVEFVAAIAEHEPRTKLYSAFQQRGDDARFLNVMIFDDEQAEEHHRATDHVKRFTEVLYRATLDGVVFTPYDVVASTKFGDMSQE